MNLKTRMAALTREQLESLANGLIGVATFDPDAYADCCAIIVEGRIKPRNAADMHFAIDWLADSINAEKQPVLGARG